jgi:RNA polymerase sigma-70 factor (ECF subfamily)
MLTLEDQKIYKMAGGGLHAYDDGALFALYQSGKAEAFDAIYARYWERLYHYAFHNLQSKDLAFEIVHEIFVSFWTRRETLTVDTSLSGYLFAAVRYQIIKHIQGSKQKEAYLKDYLLFVPTEVNATEEAIHLRELEKAIEDSLQQLPARCQEIFHLSRREHKSIREIALQLNISHRTVENQLTHALKHLRVSLGDMLLAVAVILAAS